MSILVRGITKLYGGQKALDDVSFEVKTGEIVGFLGPNGAGKSTMMKIIKTIGYLPENNPLYPEMYVREYLGFVSSLYKTGSVRERIDHIIEVTGLAPEQKKKIGSLSKGYRQRVGLAQALIHDPAVLILDEATTGLDPNQIIEIRNLIIEAGKEKTVMFSTHIMQEAEAVCDRIIIINNGKIMADELKNNIHSVIKKHRQIIKIEFDKTPEISELQKITGIVSARSDSGNIWIIEAEGEDDIRPAIFSFAVKNNLTVLSLQKEESNLEEVFRHLTNG